MHRKQRLAAAATAAALITVTCGATTALAGPGDPATSTSPSPSASTSTSASPSASGSAQPNAENAVQPKKADTSTESPAADASTSTSAEPSDAESSKAPQPKSTDSGAEESQSPAAEDTESPAAEDTESPAAENSESPAAEDSESPAGADSPAAEESSAAPIADEGSPTTTQDKSGNNDSDQNDEGQETPDADGQQAGNQVSTMAKSKGPGGQTVTSDKTAKELAQKLIGKGLQISNSQYTGNKDSAGIFEGFGKATGIGSGVALSSGFVVDNEDTFDDSAILGPNESDSNGGSLDTDGDPQLTELAGVETNDASVLEFDFVPSGENLRFTYVFGSEEYNEYADPDTNYNDVFALTVNGTNCAKVPGTNDPVSIQNVNKNTNAKFYRNNERTGTDDNTKYNTEMDGMTTALDCKASVNPGESNHLKLAIADASDSAWDSSVLIKAESIEVNDPPTADDQQVNAVTNTPVDIKLAGGDPNGDKLTYAIGDQPQHGTLSGKGANRTYTPDDGFTGEDTFTYTTNDGEEDSKPGTVTITVAENQPPVAEDDSYTTSVGQELTVDAPGVLENDSDPNKGQDVTAKNDYSQPSHGQVELNADGSFSYTPEDGYTGKDTFSYTVTDGSATSDAAEVTITVAENKAPVAKPDSYSTGFGVPLTIDAPGVLKNDSDPDGDDITTENNYSQPSSGEVELEPNGSFVYTPQDGFSGEDTFSYTVTDGNANSDSVEVTITVEPNQDPQFENDAYTIEQGETLSVDAPGVLENDSDPDQGQTLTVSDYGQPENGSVEVNEDGSFTYTPNDGFTGEDTFKYNVSDGYTEIDPYVTITVEPTAGSEPSEGPEPTTEPSTGPTAEPTDEPSDDGSSLPNTGSEVSPGMIIGGIGALIAGVGALIAGRRMR